MGDERTPLVHTDGACKCGQFHPTDERTPAAESVTALAADIRAVDGNHDLGASALAEALIERGWSQKENPDER